MKKQIVILIIAIIILLPVGAQAGKPGPTPYPRPAEVMSEAAYPPPLQPTVVPMPDPDSLIPDVVLEPSEDCTYAIGVPCALGLFTVDGGLTRWYVTVDGPVNVEPLAFLCIMWRNIYGQTWDGCIDLRFHSYRPYRNLYVSDEWHVCGSGSMYFVSVDYVTGQIPLPNLWLVDCWFFPYNIRAGVCNGTF